MALPDEFQQILQAHRDSGRVVAAGDLGQHPVDVGLAAVELGEQLLDRAPFVEHRHQPVPQALLPQA